MVEIAGRSYRIVVGSDVVRDGMFLEVEDNTHTMVAEIFYDDGDHSMRFTAYKPDLPLPLIEWMIDNAKKSLTPTKPINS